MGARLPAPGDAGAVLTTRKGGGNGEALLCDFLLGDITEVCHNIVRPVPEPTGCLKSGGLVVAPRLVARPDARPSLRSGLVPCCYEDMSSRMISARGTDVVRELVRHFTDGRDRVGGGSVVIHLDDGARVIGDPWRNEA